MKNFKYIVMRYEGANQGGTSCERIFDNETDARQYAQLELESYLDAELASWHKDELTDDSGRYLAELGHEEVDFAMIIDTVIDGDVKEGVGKDITAAMMQIPVIVERRKGNTVVDSKIMAMSEAQHLLLKSMQDTTYSYFIYEAEPVEKH